MPRPRKASSTKKPKRSRKTSVKSVLKSRGSVTEKTKGHRIKSAILRRSKKRSDERLDSSLPATLKQHSFHSSWHKFRRAPVQVGDGHTLSPFVLTLKEHIPSPQEILDEEFAPIRLNLLDGHGHEPIAESTTDLSLSAQDVESQLIENSLTSLGLSRLALPLKSQLRSTTLPKKAHIHVPMNVFESFDPASLAPQEIPEDIFSFFDFPEEEDQHEADLVTLEDLRAQVEPQHAPKKTRVPRLRIPLPHGWQRAMGAFVAISFIFVLPLHAMNVVHELRDTKAEVTLSSEQALSYFEAGASAALKKQAHLAASSFELAEASFARADESLNNLGGLTSLVLSALPMTHTEFAGGKALLTTLKELSTAGTRLAEGFETIESLTDPTPLNKLEQLEVYLTSALPHLQAANTSVRDVPSELIPETQRATFTQLSEQIPILTASVEEFLSLSELLKYMIGDVGAKRYLLVFQNNTEIRPTGGFMGSFAELKVRDGRIESFNVPGGGTYDLQGRLTKFVAAPKPLQLLKARWEFQDTNWFPDFPTSARQILDFYSAAGGPTVDGVIAINATYVAELIGLLGPINMPEYERTISEENFVFEAQKIVELEYDREENKPKAFIGDLAEQLIETTNERPVEDFLALFEHLNLGLQEKDVQVYFTKDEIQKEARDRGWDGSLKQTEGDYLMVVNTNLGGGKTDSVIDEHIHVDAHVNEKGRIINTVTIRRTHNGIPGLVFTGVNNVNYTRLYVPKGSTLLDADGFDVPPASLFETPEEGWDEDEDLLFIASTQQKDLASGTVITEEFGKTVFGNWIQTMPGKTSVARITYELPFTFDELQDLDTFDKLRSVLGLPVTQRYTLTVQKQPGIETRQTSFSLRVPENFEHLFSSLESGETLGNESDALIGILYQARPL